MRVTNSMVVTSSLRDINGALARLQKAQTTLSTGKTILRASDDPAGATAAMTLRNQLRRSDQQGRALTDARAWLGAADTALMSGLDAMTRVKELTVRASNLGTNDPATRDAIASELDNIRTELLGLANTTYLDRPIFNGSATGRAYDPDTGLYLGNDAAVTRDVAPNTSIRVNLTGEEIFGEAAAPEGDLFAVLDRLATAVRSGDAASLAQEHGHLDAASSRLTSATAELGSRAARLEAVQARADIDEVNLRQTLSSLEDADIAEALIDVNTRENAYTAALQAASRVIPPSLLDYLR